MSSDARHLSLIVLGGLPGTGKTTIAREIVRCSPAAYLRIDTIEQALMRACDLREPGPGGYLMAYEIARSNLALGVPVLIDGVNPVARTRDAWRRVATDTGAQLLEVEVVCPDVDEHRRRVEGRTPDIAGRPLPTWASVLRHEYEPWTTERLVVDSSRMRPIEAAQFILARVQR